jgi:hypothetical protein
LVLADGKTLASEGKRKGDAACVISFSFWHTDEDKSKYKKINFKIMFKHYFPLEGSLLATVDVCSWKTF